MKKVIFLILAGIVVVLVVIGIQSSIKKAQTTVITIEDIQEREGIPVVTVQAERRDLFLVRNFTGSIKGIEQADATAMILEKIETIHVPLGARVRKGQVLLSLDHQNPTVRYQQTNDALAEAEKELERSTGLLKAGAISEQIHDKAVLAEKIARADFDAINRLLEIRAPVDGIVTDIFRERGETVSPGVPIIRIAKLDIVITEIEVGETDIALVKKGLRARVRTNSFPGKTFHGILTKIALSTNPDARNFTIKIEIPNPEHLLKPGMFTIVDLIIAVSAGVAATPIDALISENGKSYIYVLQGDMTVRKELVTTGIVDGEWVEIIDGVAVDDTVVLEGHNRLTDGSIVVIVS